MMGSKRYKSLPPDIVRLRLEAIFHPKFENETPDSEIRRKMLDGVASGDGYIEASLKHSGSLLLWSGRQRYYSKNSTNNAFSRVGEIMLMRHFARCFGRRDWRGEYERCGELVHRSRLTCSFEVVTSVLGHHGDLPARDYLILIAVADRGCGTGRFFSTSELVRFAQAHRLPHNDAWIFSSIDTCEALFRSYEELRDTGTATTVVDRLDRIVSECEGGRCAKVASLYPHKIFQGDILEGIVIRYVPHRANNHVVGDRMNSFDEMKELCAASNQLLVLVPPSATVDEQSNEDPANDAIRRVDLRALAERDDFEMQLDNLLQTFHGPNYRRIQSSRDLDSTSPLKCIDVVKLANEIILASSSTSGCLYDRETLDIARLIQTLDQLRIDVSYNLLDEETLDDERFLCILRINHDSSFVKYHKFVQREGSGGLMLFRGFSIELVPSIEPLPCNDSNVANEYEGASLPVAESTLHEEKLMLKMKFLPYMVRTFVCRNGLPILMNNGIPSFEHYAIDQLTKWNVSDEAVRKWVPFFQGWAKYCTSPLDANLPPLTANKYLHHYNRFYELFASGRFQGNPEMASSFHGLIVIVGPSKDSLRALALGLSSELQCSKIVDDIRQISEKMVMLSRQRSRGGLICISEIKEGVTCLRRLAKNHHEAIFIIMVQGDDGMFDSNNNNSRKVDGMIQSWKNTKCNMMLELPRESAMKLDADATIEYLRSNDTAKEVLAKLKACSESHQPDEHPGLIVYFPLIPGSGKSSLCRDITADALGIGNGRKLVQMEGDQVGRKFYAVVTKELLSNHSSVAILDKNVPPTSFPSVHKLCAESNSIALHVLPTGMADTYVGASMDVYPFTLQFLAVCMARVLNRKPGTHPGKLDSAIDCACMVVVKFYCFYRHLTASRLKEKLRGVGYEGKVMFFPFFKEEILPDLPTDLKQALEDAVALQTREDKKICKADEKDLVSMDERLRSSIRDNRSYIDSLTVPLEVSRSMFIRELSNVIASLPDKLESGILNQAGSIQIASLDFDFGLVHAEIEKLRQIYPEIDQYFAQREANKTNDQDDESKDRYITSVHCTFAHASQVPQSYMLASFQHLIGSTAEMKATALLFNEKIAALELEVPNDDSIPRPNNAFPHITIWCSENSKAYESNDLPEMVKCNKATRVDFGEHVVLKGVFSFWYNPVDV